MKHYGFSFMFPNLLIRISSKRTEIEQTKPKTNETSQCVRKMY